MTIPLRQTIHLHNRVHRALAAQPITTGLPWPKGELAADRVASLRVHDDAGRPVAAAFTPLNTWPDGSVQWTLMDASLDMGPSVNVALTIAPDSSKPGASGPASSSRRPAPAPSSSQTSKYPVNASITGDKAHISNGLVAIELSTQQGTLVSSWTVRGKALIEADGFDLTFVHSDGTTYSAAHGPRKITVEHANAVRAVIRIDGKHGVVNDAKDALPAKPQAAGTKEGFLDYFIRIEVRADRDDAKITYAFRNRELPTPGISISNMRAMLRTTVAPGAKRCFTANTLTRHYLNRSLRVDEDPVIVASDTGDIANYTATHKDKHVSDCFVANPEVLHDPVEEKPWWLRDVKFRLVAGGSKCVWPYLAILDERKASSGGAMVSIQGMTCLHPKSLTVNESTFQIGLYPEWAGPLEITQGAGRSHNIFVGPVAPDASDIDIQNRYLSWEYGGVHTHIPSGLPIEIKPDLAHVRRCKVFAIHMLPEYDPVNRFAFERKVMDAWIGVSYGQLGAVDQVQHWPTAGFWHYGDQGLANNEEMHNLVYFQNYLRTGNFGCFEYAMAGTTHMLEVDHCAFSTDHLQTGGQVAHTVNHNHGTAYPSHEWFTEYLFAYVLTGDREFIEAAKRTCEHLLYWINKDEGFQIIAADQREAGQPMINLTWCYDFTKDPRYLDGCWKIVRDCLMANTQRFGRMLDGKPIGDPVKVCSYGDYAAWEGMYWLWEALADVPQSGQRREELREELRGFMLSQLEWRVTPEFCGVHGFHRTTDYNPAAYAFYLTGDRKWLERVSYPFWHAFRAARWPLGWVHAMYFTKLAFDHHLVSDRDVLVQ